MTELITAQTYHASAKQTAENIIQEVNSLDKTARPKLIIIKATDDESAKRYVNNKIKLGEEFGVTVIEHAISENAPQAYVENIINVYNKDARVHGIMVQLPVYNHLDGEKLCNTVDPKKDVDGLHFENLGRLACGTDPEFVPCTPLGVLNMLHLVGVSSLRGEEVVIVGKGKTSGAPMANLFIHKGATVTICSSKTKDLKSKIENADIVISCVGKRNLISSDWFKKDAIVIGVGLSYDGAGKQRLDFEVEELIANKKVRYVTNRINATGSATVVSLMLNTLIAYKRQNEESSL